MSLREHFKTAKVASILAGIFLLVSPGVYASEEDELSEEYKKCSAEVENKVNEWMKKNVDPSYVCADSVLKSKRLMETIRCAGIVPEDYLGKDVKYLEKLSEYRYMGRLMGIIRKGSKILTDPYCQGDDAPHFFLDKFK